MKDEETQARINQIKDKQEKDEELFGVK